MIGPEGVKVPPKSQGLGLGDKLVSDLTDDPDLSVDGDTVTFTGSLKNITEPWTEYSKTNNTGHFIPMMLPAVCQDEDITIKGRVDGDRTAHVGDDLILVLRLENLTGTTATIEMNDAELMSLDFTALIPTGEDAYDSTKEDFGRFGKKEQYVRNLNIVWDGIKGTATGELLKHEAIGEGKVSAGHHFPLSMASWFGDGIKKDVTIKNKRTITDKDIICTIDDVKVITVEYQGVKVLELDLTGMTVGE